LAYYYDAVLAKLSGRKVLSYDIYPLLQTNGRRNMRQNWLPGLNVLANFAKEKGCETHVYVQAAEHMGYPVMTEEDLRFQFNVYMTFGVTNYSYFLYALRPDGKDWFSAMVRQDKSCATWPLYDGAKRVAGELQALQHIYLNYGWLGAMPVIGSENLDEDGEVVNEDGNMNFAGLTEIPFLKRAEATQNTLLGRFKDKDGRDGLMVTNFTQPADERTDAVTLAFRTAKKVAVYTMGGEEVFVLPADGVLKMNLAPGQGAFMLPLS
jgi:hypothetical protein